MKRLNTSNAGFSMIEIIVAIVVMSILSIGLVEFITNTASSYTLSAARNQVSASGRVVIDRIAMELHNALPESVRISAVRTVTNADGFAGDQCLEFIPVRAATTYINPAFRPAAHKTTFNVIDLLPNHDGVTDVYAVIYPTSADDLYDADIGAGSTTEAIVEVSVIADADAMDGVNEITTTTNHRFRRRSSVERIFITDQPVSFCVTDSKLYRYSNYGFNPATPLLPRRPNGTCAAGPAAEDCLPSTTPDRVLISDQLDNSTLTGGAAGEAFDQLAASRRRNAVIQLELNFSQQGQQVRLNHEVLQRTTP